MRSSPAPSVLHLLWSGRIGGIERLVQDLAFEQARQGQEVAVAFGQATGPFADTLKGAGLSTIDLGLRSGLDVWRAALSLGKDNLSGGEVIHLHSFNLPLAGVALAARRPVVFTEHGNFGIGRRATLADRLKRRAQGAFIRYSVKGLAANSEFTKRRLAAIYGVDVGQISVVHNGVRVEGTGPPSPTLEAGITAACVGRLVSWKRVDLILQALKLARHVEGLELRVVGGGPLEEELRRRARDCDVERQVAFLGWRSDLDRALEGVDVLIHPSQDEPFGLAIVEGCAQGLLPIVFADGGGALEVIPAGAPVVSGAAELARVLESLCGSELLSPAARRARSEWAREAFSIEKTAREYLQLYRTALAGAR